MIEAQIAALERNVDAFAQTVGALEEPRFLEPLRKWTPRDIVAHLVGWNRHLIEGSRQILRGELPFYDVDPGENYARINADLVRKYPSRDREALLDELRRSAFELAAFLRTLDERAWEADFGVRNHGETITVRSSVDDLIADYAHHRDELAAIVPSP